MDDHRLLELIRTGNNDLALRELYRNFPAIRKLIRSKGGTGKDAEDVFQEALLILIRNSQKHGFQLTARLSTYLYSVCRFLWNDELRRRRPTLPYSAETGLDPADETQLHTELEKEQRIRLAERVLDELKDRCRELLLLFYCDKLPLKEVALRMNYSSGNVAKNQKYKCLEAAKLRLKELHSTSKTY
ncbi:MAG TPA: sigma-70 family RNA polymerase sigma factor [Puia sp.]|jgi:RNA polymerase sigma factor (sigma-70 family)|nr:sigma-70 family RNA polymerase sigma factor [Puia sp.]